MSRTKLYAEIVNGFHLLTIFAKSSTLVFLSLEIGRLSGSYIEYLSLILSCSYFRVVQVEYDYKITIYSINLEKLMKTFCFDKYVRMSLESFQYLLNVAGPKIAKKIVDYEEQSHQLKDYA